jgi:hypothetical protein
VFTEIGRWINDNLGPWADYLGTKFSEAFTLISTKVGEMWTAVEPTFTVIKDWLSVQLTTAVTAIGTKWGEVMAGFGSTVDTAKGKVQPFIDAIKGFWDWISGKVFEFKISIPNLPEWAVPGSPLPLHTAWEDFGDYLSGERFAPQFDMGGVGGAENVVGLGAGGARGTMAGGSVTNNYIDITVNDGETGRVLLAYLEQLTGA